jgi:hypothetical protein
MYAMFWADPNSGLLAFVGVFKHSVHREPLFDAGTSPVYPKLLPGMCHLQTQDVVSDNGAGRVADVVSDNGAGRVADVRRTDPLDVDVPHSVTMRPGLCLFISGCTGKCRANTFVSLVKADNRLCLIVEPEDLEG